MNVRNVTTKSTIPAGTTAWGTVTSDTNNSSILRGTLATEWALGAVTLGQLVVYEGQVFKNLTGTNGTVAPSLDKTNWAFHVPDQRSFIWIYIPDSGSGSQALAKIESISPMLDSEASTYRELYYMDRSIPTTGAVAFEVVVGNLRSWSLDNNGGADGQLGGEVLKSGTIIDRVEEDVILQKVYQDVEYFDATGTNYYILEN